MSVLIIYLAYLIFFSYPVVFTAGTPRARLPLPVPVNATRHGVCFGTHRARARRQADHPIGAESAPGRRNGTSAARHLDDPFGGSPCTPGAGDGDRVRHGTLPPDHLFQLRPSPSAPGTPHHLAGSHTLPPPIGPLAVLPYRMCTRTRDSAIQFFRSFVPLPDPLGPLRSGAKNISGARADRTRHVSGADREAAG